MAGVTDLKTGFWLGLGLLLAFLVIGLLQAFVSGRGRRDG